MGFMQELVLLLNPLLVVVQVPTTSIIQYKCIEEPLILFVIFLKIIKIGVRPLTYNLLKIVFNIKYNMLKLA